MSSKAKEYIAKAENSLNSNNYEEFLLSIGKAEAYVNGPDSLADLAYFKAKGLFVFRKYDSATPAIEEALLLNKDADREYKLLKAKAHALAYRDQYADALRIFMELTTKTSNRQRQMAVYISITWVLLLECKSEPKDDLLDMAKVYLDRALEIIDTGNCKPSDKRLVLNNYSEYYKYRKDYAMAIEMLDQAIPLCPESKLCEIYNDMAQLYLEQGNDELMRKYINEAEISASRFGNEVEKAKALYTSAKAKIQKGEYAQAMDSLYVVFYSFVNCGLYNYANDCLGKMNEVNEALKSECISRYSTKFAQHLCPPVDVWSAD